MQTPMYCSFACAAMLLAACTSQVATREAPTRYLPRNVLDANALLPRPPDKNTEAFALDQAVARHAAALRDTPRWNVAIQDAILDLPAAADAFSCALGTALPQDANSPLMILLARSKADASASTGKPKEKYNRTRPFVENGTSMCTPDSAEALKHNGSYPSGHTTIGWTWALILAEVAPDRADAVLQRGREFGQSRVVCNVHWQSDVDAGRMLASAVVARLHAEPLFEADLARAKEELAAIRKTGAGPTRDCGEEARALAIR